MANQPRKSKEFSKRDPKTAPTSGTAGNGNHSSARLPVVGIGASAGGIEALSSFFDAMPADSGCAFVVVLHLDPKRESEMARILGTHTRMPVAQVEDGMALAPDRVYSSRPIPTSNCWTAR